MASGELRLVSSRVHPAKGHMEILDTIAYSVLMHATLLTCNAADLVAHVRTAALTELNADQAVAQSKAAERGSKGAPLGDFVPADISVHHSENLLIFTIKNDVDKIKVSLKC